MKKNKNFSILNTKKQSLTKTLFSFFVIAIPALLIWIFFSKDFPFAEHFSININFWFKLLIALAFLLITFLVTIICIYFKFIEISTLIFSLPISICFMIIFISDDLEPWIRALILIPFIFLIIPIGMIVKKYEYNKALNSKKNKNNEIIGYRNQKKE